jgi:hypothetical protein
MSFALLKNVAYVEMLVVIGYAIFYSCLRKQAKREVGFGPAIVFLVLTAAIFLTPNLWALQAIFFLTVPLLARNREQVGLFYLAGLLATPPFETPLSAGGVELVPHTTHSSLALGALLALALKGGRKVHRRLSSDAPAAAILLLILIATARETAATNWLRQAVYVSVALAAPYFVVTRSITSAESLRKLLLWLVAACSMLSVIALYESITYWPLYREAGDLLGLKGSGLFLLRSGFMRASGPLNNSITLGFALVLGFAAALVSARSFPNRAKHLGVVALICVGLLAPQSRSAWLGAAIVLVLIHLYRFGGRRSGALAIAGGLAASAAYLATGSSGDDDAAVTVEYRNRLFARGMEEFWKNPLLGDGTNDVMGRLGDLVQGQGIVDFVNTYLYFGLFTGAIGTAVFILALGIPAALLWLARSRVAAGSEERDVAAFCFAVLLSSMAMLMVISLWGRIELLTIILLGLAGTATLAQKRAKSSSPRGRAPAAPLTAPAERPV